MTTIHFRTLLLLALAGATACGPTVEDACENVAEQCVQPDSASTACIDTGSALEESGDLDEDALQCMADAESCEEALACPGLRADDEEGSFQ
ncbi:MAG: hypothetical protein OEZ06_02640 [Myxococcales bacterium]|nr:hypothetical protein [Myxococcales bacterium]